MMLKTVLFAAVAMTLLSVSNVKAEDDFLSEVANLNASSISDADNAIQEDLLAGVDVDGLASKAGTEKSGEAIEACFRRFGWGGGCYNSYNYGCYNYNHCYRPYFNCYPTYFHCYRPVVQVSYVTYPVYSYYWGCH